MTYGLEPAVKEESTNKCLDYNPEYDRQRLDEAPIDHSYVIITEPMIIDCLNKQLPSGDEGKYARMVKLDIKTVTLLKMEFRSISEIANLQQLTSLTKLQLCNNVIKKIQNLEVLENLVWLDLSYNSIRKIEGLDKLTKLEVIDLHRNFITTLENLDNNLRLQMFHISTNKLDNLENLRYLRQFVRLSSVSLQGNPVSMDPEFIHYFIAFVPQVQLIDYVNIPRVEREIAAARHKVQADKYGSSEDKLIRRASYVEAQENVRQLQKEAFIDGLQGDEFWENMYENDANGKSLLEIGETQDIQHMYKELFRRATKGIFDKGMRAYEQRQSEVTAHGMAVSEEMEKVQKPGNAMTEEFVEYGRQTLKDVRVLVSLIEDNERRVQNGLAHELPPEFPEFQNQLNILIKEYVNRLHDIWFTLIHHEMDFNEHMEDTNELLDQSTKEIVTNWLEQVQGQFAQLRDLQEQLNAKLMDTFIEKPPPEVDEDEEEEDEEDEDEEEEEEEEGVEGEEMEMPAGEVPSGEFPSEVPSDVPFGETQVENIAVENPSQSENTASYSVPTISPSINQISSLSASQADLDEENNEEGENEGDDGEEEEDEEEDEDEEEEEDEDEEEMEFFELDSIEDRIQMSHEHHMSFIADKEEQILQGMKNWLEEYSTKLLATEYERNKSRLNEISHFIDTHYGYLEETRGPQNATQYIPPVRADQDCTEASSCEPLMWYERLKKRLRAREKKFKHGKEESGTHVAVRSKSKLAAAVPTRTSFIL